MAHKTNEVEIYSFFYSAYEKLLKIHLQKEAVYSSSAQT